MNSKKLGYALVGLGNLSEYQIAPALQKTKYCELKGLVSNTPSKLKRWSAKYNIPKKNLYNYNNFDQIADNPDIDIIYIILPNSMHAEFTIRAAKAGKHVICEKPIANSIQEGKKMIKACKTAGKQLAVAYRLNFEPYNQEIIRLSQKKVFGKTKIIEASFCFRLGGSLTQWRLKKDIAGGGALMDVGTYILQAARHIIGKEPLSVTAQEFKTNHKKFKEVDETVIFQLTFPDGIIANCNVSYAGYINRLHVAAENGWFKLEPAFLYNGWSPTGKSSSSYKVAKSQSTIKGWTSKSQIHFPPINQFVVEMDNFAWCILNNKKISVYGEEGLKDLKIIQALYKSIKLKREIRLK